MSEPTTPPAESAELACPECSHLITYYDVKGSEYYVCPHCHAYFRCLGEEKPVGMGYYKQAPKAPPVMALGARLALRGHAYRMVGVVARYEARHQQYSWREYQLFRPDTCTYVQLSEFDGHWILIAPATQEAEARKVFHLPNFKLFNKYQSRIDWALGEFDWNIEGDERLNVTEYICPPYLLVQEQQGKHRAWYHGWHLEPQEVAEALQLNQLFLPTQAGVGAIQPSPVATVWPMLKALTLLATALLLGLFVGLHLLHPRQTLLNESLPVVADPAAAAGTGKVIVSPSFALDRQAALDIDLTATLSNQWLELPVSLVNEQTGQGFEFTKNIEFYEGVEDGESWSEGSREASAVLSSVPAGRYHLNLYPATEAGPAAPDITVAVVANPVLWSNFFLVLGLLLLYPAWMYWQFSTYERRRWENSDYNPYSTE